MTKVKGGLGKGLNALIPENRIQNDRGKGEKGEIFKAEINSIKPNRNQPRKEFDPDKIASLVESIKLHGIIQPIVVRPISNGYEIVAGERRWRASREAGLKEIPCIVKELDDKQGMEIALIENLQREDLNAIEEAMAYKGLIDNFQMTQEQISAAIGKSRSNIANTLRLLNLDGDVKNMVVKNEITSGHARALLRLEDSDVQKKTAKEVKEKNMSVRETEDFVTLLLQNKEKKIKRKKEKDHTLYFIEESLKAVFGTKVNVIKGKKKGKIEIEYYSEEELERLVGLLQNM
ncbi:MAG: ParB/RepB/Spo0J family partition protein [Bacillota bacterium]